MQYPDFDSQPEKVRQAFVGALKGERFHDRYEGDTIYDKMVDAYQMALYRHGGHTSPAPAASVQQQPQVRKSPNPQARKQALVSGGDMAPNMPTLDLKTMSFDDILERGEYLLDL